MLKNAAINQTIAKQGQNRGNIPKGVRDDVPQSYENRAAGFTRRIVVKGAVLIVVIS